MTRQGKVFGFGKVYFIIIAVSIFFALNFPTITNAETVLKAVSYVAASKKEVSHIVFQNFISKVNTRAKGKIKIDYIGGPEVIPPGDQMSSLGKGMVHVLLTVTYHSSVIPEVNSLMLSQITPAQEREVGFHDLMVKLHREKFGTIPLARADSGVPFLLWTNNKISQTSELSGLKFRSNVNYAPFLKKLGIVPVNLSPSQLYTAMERNLVEGFPWPIFITAMGFQEVTKYGIDNQWWYGGSKGIYMNAKTYDGLSDELKKIIDEAAIESEKEAVELSQKMVSKEKESLIKSGIEFIKLKDGDKIPNTANEVAWETIIEKSPELGPKIKKMLSKN